MRKRLFSRLPPLSLRARLVALNGVLVAGFSLFLVVFLLRGQDASRMAVAAALFSAAWFLAAAAVGHFLVRPLSRITDLARRIAAGSDEAPAACDRERGDEVGQLATALDQMLYRLYERKAVLQFTRDELARAEASERALNATLEQRVAELALANAQLAERLRELRAAQAHLVVADRRTTLGQLAAGVAHEINNPLAFLLGNLRFVTAAIATLRREHGGGSSEAGDMLAEMSEAVSESLQGGERVRFIVQSLKAFSRADEAKIALRPVDVRSALNTAAAMAGHEIKHRAQLVRDYRPVPPVLANEVQIGQVFLNLIVNAAQSIPEGHPSQHQIRLSARSEGADVVIEISDTGCGIAPDVMNRIFDPFFTTKPVGEGTGLGLSICQGIVAALGGSIAVKSDPGRGSTFRVTLPASAQATQTDPIPAGAGAPLQRSRILVVDDDALVGKSLHRELASEHDVVVAQSGAEALQLTQSGARFDLVLCDLMMPSMNGMQYLARLEETDPAQAAKVVFITGGAFTGSAQDFRDKNPARCLEKPLEPAQLRSVLERVVA